MAHEQPTFIYDGDCGVCTWVVQRLARSSRGNRVTWLTSESLDQLPAGLTSEDVELAAWYVVGRRAYGGFSAFRRLTLRLPLLWLLVPLFWFPGMRVIGDLVYRQIALRRRAISMRLGLAACSLRSLPDATRYERTL